MQIIAQKNNTLTTEEFVKNSLSKDFIDSMSINVTYTRDDKIVVYSAPAPGSAITNTINSSTLGQLQGYEVILLTDMLELLKNNSLRKPLYINLAPYNSGILSDDNIQEVTTQMNRYVERLQKILDAYPELELYVHSINRSLVSLLKEKLVGHRIGFAVTGADINFIDVDYYLLLATTQNDLIIDTLLKSKKEVIVYIYSDYYLSYLYEYYLGEKSTPYLQQTFEKLSFMGNYPEIMYKVFQR